MGDSASKRFDEKIRNLFFSVSIVMKIKQKKIDTIGISHLEEY